jgi:hypothetical protein
MEPQSSGDVCPLDADFGALPEAVVLMLFSQLPLKDMQHAGSTCHHWHRCEVAGHTQDSPLLERAH